MSNLRTPLYMFSSLRPYALKTRPLIKTLSEKLPKLGETTATHTHTEFGSSTWYKVLPNETAILRQSAIATGNQSFSSMCFPLSPRLKYFGDLPTMFYHPRRRCVISAVELLPQDVPPPRREELWGQWHNLSSGVQWGRVLITLLPQRGHKEPFTMASRGCDHSTRCLWKVWLNMSVPIYIYICIYIYI